MKTRKKIKQAIAMLLATGMVVTGLPTGGLEAKANVLTPNASIGASVPNDNSNKNFNKVGGFVYGSSDTTAFVFGNSQTPDNHIGTNGDGGGGGDTFTFNIAGILDNAHRSNTSKGYYSSAAPSSPYDAPGLVSAYPNNVPCNWWHGYYAFGKPNRVGTDVQNKIGGSPYEQTNPLDPVITGWGSNGVPTTSTWGASALRQPLHTGSPHENGEVLYIDIPNSGSPAKKLELRQEVKPSDDGQYILVQYTVHNTSSSDVHFMVGNETDTQLGSQDAVPIMVTKHGAGEKFEGLHFQNSGGQGNSTSYSPDQTAFSIFDIISEGNNVAGMNRRTDGTDKSENRVWAGKWTQTAGRSHTQFVFAQTRSVYLNPGDSAAAFSAYFDLKGGETKTSTFALAIKPLVLYVNPNYGSTPARPGFIASPYRTLKEAIDGITSISRTDIKKAYIYLQGDVEVSDKITIPQGYDVTIQTADFEPIDNSASPNETGYFDFNITPKTTKAKISRKAGYKGAMFEVSNTGSSLNFLDVKVDGNGVEATEPIVNARDRKSVV